MRENYSFTVMALRSHLIVHIPKEMLNSDDIEIA